MKLGGVDDTKTVELRKCSYSCIRKGNCVSIRQLNIHNRTILLFHMEMNQEREGLREKTIILNLNMEKGEE